MRLKRLTAVNFCQHEKLVHDYIEGTTGMFGPNGAGKTNFVKFMQQFSLTGGLSKTTKTKSDLLRFGTKKGYTLCEFEHNGLEYSLQRNLQGTKRILTQGDNTWQQAEADKTMIEIMGMEPDVFYEVCFVDQGKIWEILEMTHAKRMEYFQKITEAKRAEILRKMLDDASKKLPAYIDRSADIKGFEERLAELTEETTSLATEKDSKTLLKNKFDAIHADTQAILSLITKEQYDATLLEKHTTYTTVYNTYEKFLADNQVNPVAEALYPFDMKDQRDAKLQYDNLAKQLVTERENKSNVDAQLQALVLPEAVAPFDNTANTEKAADIRAQLKTLEEGKCVTCGRDFDTAGLDKEALSEELRIITASTAEAQYAFNEKSKAYNDALLSQKDLLRQQETSSKAITTLEAEQENLSAPAEFDEDAFNAAVNASLAYQEFVKRKAEVDTQIQTHTMAIQQAKAAYDLAQETKYVSVEARAKASEFITNYNELTQQITQLDTRLQILEVESRNVTENRDRYAQEQEARNKVFGVKSLFEGSRDLLHRECLPKVVMSGLLVGLNTEMSRMLSYFHTDFRAYLDNDFDFKVDFEDADGMDADYLSGGQKVILSLAFHIGLANLLADSIPFMVLDEPTNHVDKENKPLLRDALLRLKGAGAKGTEFMIVTHDEVLQPVFDREIDFSKKEG